MPRRSDQDTTSLGTSEARAQLPELVKRASNPRKRARSLRDNAVEIRTRGVDGSATLLPTADIDAAEARIAALEAEREELQEDLEDAGIALLVAERLSAPRPDTLTAAEFLQEIGMSEFVEQLPRR